MCQLRIPKPIKKKSFWLAEILHVDRFGNVIITMANEWISKVVTIQIGKKTITNKVKIFSDLKPKEFGIAPGSSGHLELVQNQGSAAQALNLSTGDKVKIHFSKEG